ncbi:hypothetical protein C8F01DRAFT_664202 [Mycena amicta]|nr:hypothetical protein C8F01DRAFT_664202 [Mycena amicta]
MDRCFGRIPKRIWLNRHMPNLSCLPPIVITMSSDSELDMCDTIRDRFNIPEDMPFRGWPQLLPNNQPLDGLTKQQIRQRLQAARGTLTAIENALAEVEQAKRALIAQATVLDAQVGKYQGVVSRLRELPAELLIIIFKYCLATRVTREKHPFHRDHPLRAISQTCHRWRAVAIGAPMLWGNVIQTKMVRLERELQMTRLQLERVRKADIYVWMPHRSGDNDAFLQVVLGHREQWREAELNLSMEALAILLKESPLPKLRKLDLKLHYTDDEDMDDAFADQAVIHARSDSAKFPVLDELMLELLRFPPRLLSIFSDVWAQLRVCVLDRPLIPEILSILPSFGRDAQICFKSGLCLWETHTPPLSPAISLPVSAIHFENCAPDFQACILDSIGEAPFLKSLVVDTDVMASLEPFLSRARCTLEYLHLDKGWSDVSTDKVFVLLELASVRGITELEWRTTKRGSLDDVVTKFCEEKEAPDGQGMSLVVPALRRLTLPGLDGYQCASLDKLEELQRARAGTLEHVVLRRYPNGFQSTEDLERIADLKNLGLEVQVGVYKEQEI